MNSETIKGRLNLHLKRRLQSQESIEKHNSSQPSRLTPSVVGYKSIIVKEEPIESAPVKSPKKRKITKKSSVVLHAVDSNQEDDEKCERLSDRRNEKQFANLDILTLILNHKKAEFLRNPQLIQLLNEIDSRKCESMSSVISDQ